MEEKKRDVFVIDWLGLRFGRDYQCEEVSEECGPLLGIGAQEEQS